VDFASLVRFAKIGVHRHPQVASAADRSRVQFEQYTQDAARIFLNASTDAVKVKALDYWLGKQATWPELAGYAVSILARPVASTSTERHFSRTVQIEGLRRVSLTPEHVQELALLMTNPAIAEACIV
jgi:hypothetical protein